MAVSARETSRLADVGWMVVAGVSAALAVLQLLGATLGFVFGPRGMTTVVGLGGSLAAWWFAKGAWLRTRRGRPPVGTPLPWDEPTLSPRQVRWYVWLGGTCVLAAAVALSIQILSAD